MSLDRVVEAYIDQEKMYHMNSRDLTKFVCTLPSYRSLEEFFDDNPGAIEAVVSWVAEQNAPMWKEAFVEALNEPFNEE